MAHRLGLPTIMHICLREKAELLCKLRPKLKRKSELKTPDAGETKSKRKDLAPAAEDSAAHKEESISPSIVLPVTPLPIAEVSNDCKVETNAPLPENIDTLVKSTNNSALDSNGTKKVEIKLKKLDIENKRKE